MTVPTPAIFAHRTKPQPVASPSAILYSTETGKGGSFSDEGKDEVAPLHEVEYPASHLLIFWWRCYKKIRFSTAAEAQEALEAHDGENDGTAFSVYSCSYCHHFHTGRASARQGVPFSSSGLRRQWRKRVKKPSLQELEAAFKSPASMGKFPNDFV